MGWDRSTISLAFFVATLAGGLSQPFLGRLYDVVGGRKVILVSLSVAGVCVLLLSLTFHIAFLIAIYGIVLSIAMSGGSLNTTSAVLAKWFRRRRATVLGIATAGASAGGLILVPFAAYLMDLTSWRVTWIALGVLVLGLALPLAFFLLRDDPKQMGLRPDGDPEPAGDGPGGGDAKAVGPDDPSAIGAGPLETVHWRDSLRSSPMWQLSGAYFVCGFTTNILSLHFVPYAFEGEGFSRGTAATAFGVMMGLNAVGVITAAALSDKYGRKNLLAVVYAGRGIAYGVLLLAPGSLGLWGFACVAGFSWIATAPLTTSLTADIYGLRNLGTLTGLSFMAHQVGGSISVLMAGVVFDATGSYTIPFAICGGLLGVASLTAFSVRERKYSVKYLSHRAMGGSSVGV